MKAELSKLNDVTAVKFSKQHENKLFSGSSTKYCLQKLVLLYYNNIPI